MPALMQRNSGRASVGSAGMVTRARYVKQPQDYPGALIVIDPGAASSQLFSDTACTTPQTTNGGTVRGVKGYKGTIYTGAALTSPTLSTTGTPAGGKCLSFDGTQFVKTGSSVSLAANNKFTAFLAFKMQSLATTQTVFQLGSLQLRVVITTNLFQANATSGGSGAGIVAGTAAWQSEWMLATVTYDGVTGVVDMVGLNDTTKAITLITVTAGTSYIGAKADVAGVPTEPANVLFGYIAIYDGVMSAPDKYSVGKLICDKIGQPWRMMYAGFGGNSGYKGFFRGRMFDTATRLLSNLNSKGGSQGYVQGALDYPLAHLIRAEEIQANYDCCSLVLDGLDGAKWYVYGSVAAASGWVDGGSNVWTHTAMPATVNVVVSTNATYANVRGTLQRFRVSVTPVDGSSPDWSFSLSGTTLTIKVPSAVDANTLAIEVGAYDNPLSMGTTRQAIVKNAVSKFANRRSLSVGQGTRPTLAQYCSCEGSYGWLENLGAFGPAGNAVYVNCLAWGAYNDNMGCHTDGITVRTKYKTYTCQTQDAWDEERSLHEGTDGEDWGSTLQYPFSGCVTNIGQTTDILRGTIMRNGNTGGYTDLWGGIAARGDSDAGTFPTISYQDCTIQDCDGPARVTSSGGILIDLGGNTITGNNPN